jgi:hypothetical protein
MRLAVPATLLCASLLLGGAIVAASVMPVEPVTVEIPPAPRHIAPVAPPAPYAPPPEAMFADIDARPLFSMQRKPLADPALAGTAASTANDFSLAGVIMGGDKAIALLRIKSTSSTMSAVVGDTVNGWRIAKIDATAVTLRSATGDVTVPLEGPADRAASAALPQDNTVTTAPVAAPAPSVVPTTVVPALQRPGAPQAAAPPVTVVPPRAPPTPVHPGGTARNGYGTIANDALKGAHIDPSTGEPTL